MYSELGTTICSLREGRNETQQQLADALGVSRSYVKSWENGERPIRSDDLYNLAVHYNVSADYLLGLSPAVSRDPELQEVAKYTGLSEDAIKNIKKCGKLCNETDDIDLLSGFLSSDWFVDMVVSLGLLRDFIALSENAKALQKEKDKTTLISKLKGFGTLATRSAAIVQDDDPARILAQMAKDLELQTLLFRYELEQKWEGLMRELVPAIETVVKPQNPTIWKRKE